MIFVAYARSEEKQEECFFVGSNEAAIARYTDSGRNYRATSFRAVTEDEARTYDFLMFDRLVRSTRAGDAHFLGVRPKA